MAKKEAKVQKQKTAKSPKAKSAIFPFSLIKPISEFLSKELKRLEQRRQRLSKEDPFSDVDRVIDNASSDTDASEQTSHAQVSALKAQTERRLIQVKKALTRIKLGKYGVCERCGKMIDTDRLMVMPETTLCVDCGKKKES